jgi:hypothetical protein
MAKFVSIGSLLDRSLKRTSVSSLVETTKILDHFDTLCHRKWGDKTKDQVKALYLRNRILTVACLSSSVAQEVQLNAHIFIKDLNKEFGAVVDKIRFLA